MSELAGCSLWKTTAVSVSPDTFPLFLFYLGLACLFGIVLLCCFLLHEGKMILLNVSALLFNHPVEKTSLRKQGHLAKLCFLILRSLWSARGKLLAL